jgi:hypothetical protein
VEATFGSGRLDPDRVAAGELGERVERPGTEGATTERDVPDGDPRELEAVGPGEPAVEPDRPSPDASTGVVCWTIDVVCARPSHVHLSPETYEWECENSTNGALAGDEHVDVPAADSTGNEGTIRLWSPNDRTIIGTLLFLECLPHRCQRGACERPENARRRVAYDCMARDRNRKARGLQHVT